MVFSEGRYRFSDFWKVGALVQLVCGFIVVTMLTYVL